MREIKFRGRSLEGWLYGEAIWFNGFPTLKDKQIYMPNPNDENCDELNVETWSMVFDVGQYTGIKDKNDKEIYEGDIVKRIDMTPIAQLCGKENVGVISFDNGSFVLNTGETTYLMGNYNLFLNNCSYEVIGNIYENKHRCKTCDYIVLKGEYLWCAWKDKQVEELGWCKQYTRY